MVDKKKVTKTIIGILVFLFLAMSAYVSYSGITWSDTDLSSVFYSTGRFAGLLGFLGIFVLVFVGETGKLFAMIFEKEKVMKFKNEISFGTLLVALLHPIFFILSSTSMARLLLPNFSALPVAMGAIGLYIVVAMHLAFRFAKYMPKFVWKIIHPGTYVLFFMIFYHAINATSYSDFLGMRIMYWTAFVLIVLAIIYRNQDKLRNRNVDAKKPKVPSKSKKTVKKKRK